LSSDPIHEIHRVERVIGAGFMGLSVVLIGTFAPDGPILGLQFAGVVAPALALAITSATELRDAREERRLEESSSPDSREIAVTDGGDER
jgi:hypothetical protein